jgi:hypothetical protein
MKAPGQNKQLPMPCVILKLVTGKARLIGVVAYRYRVDTHALLFLLSGFDDPLSHMADIES